MIVPPPLRYLRRFSTSAGVNDEIVVARHVEDRDIDRIEAGAGERLRGVLVVVAVGQALVGGGDELLRVAGKALPLVEDLHRAVGMRVLELLAVLDFVHDGERGRRGRRALLRLAHRRAGVGDDVGFLAAGLGFRRRLGGRWRLAFGGRELDLALGEEDASGGGTSEQRTQGPGRRPMVPGRAGVPPADPGVPPGSPNVGPTSHGQERLGWFASAGRGRPAGRARRPPYPGPAVAARLARIVFMAV